MKKCIVLILFVTILLCGCDFNQPLRKKMIEKYSNDKNYVTLTGEVIRFGHNKYDDKVVEIRSEKISDYIDYQTEICSFKIFSTEMLDLNLGDFIVFSTVPLHFYNGHILPIVELSVNGTKVLEFEQGKKHLLDWVEYEFR